MLEKVDLGKSLPEKQYWKEIKKWQVRLRAESMRLYSEKRTALVVFEGWDAAGKGGSIKRVTETLDPRGFNVQTFAAPTGAEARHHYLWRFWRALPQEGQLMIFDRSHYGRVMVERVEGFCREQEWKRAYREINEFEWQLTNFGTVIVKFWLHIDQDEQLRRFRERELDPFRSYKLTEEDWRNRAKWGQYLEAVEEMLEKTSTTWAPWTVIEANDKFHARVKIVQTLTKALEAGT
ncbi:MAG: polyphosphate kinase 2 family protein [Nitrospirota bacterium]